MAQKAADARERHGLRKRRQQEAATAEQQTFESVRDRARRPDDDSAGDSN